MLRLARILLSRLLAEDPSLVTLPRGVSSCRVFRNIMSPDEEDLIYAEYGRVLEREGEVVLTDDSVSGEKRVRQTYLEIHGDKDFTEVRSWSKKEIKHLPGLTWSPTLMGILKEVAPALLSYTPDYGRIVEHNIPGYEMHIEQPSSGSSFLYFNLFCDTVLEFDDEGSGRRGQVYLPARSLMRVSDEARWGFRFGELPEEAHTFTSASGGVRHIDMDLRVSIQLWKFSPNLVDGRMLQDRLEEQLIEVEQKLSKDLAKKNGRSEQAEDEREATEALAALEVPGSDRFGIRTESEKPSTLELVRSHLDDLAGVQSGGSAGKGLLGGDLNEEDKDISDRKAVAKGQNEIMTGMKDDYEHSKSKVTYIKNIFQEMKVMSDAGQPVNDLWMKKKIQESPSADAERDAATGVDPADINGTWDGTDAKARFYKARLKRMDYDGTAFLESKMPDFSNEKPLDMRSTIRKIAPYVKDGDKIVASLPGEGR